MPTSPEDIIGKAMLITKEVPQVGKVWDRVLYPEGANLGEFKKIVGDPDDDLNAVMFHMSEVTNENVNIYSLDRGQDIYTLELHHARAINRQLDDALNSTKVFRTFLWNLRAEFDLVANAFLRLNPQIRHTPLRTYGRIPPVSKWGPFWCHYGVLVMEVLNGDC